MLGRRHPRAFAALLVLLAASFAVATVQASGLHSDDGCAVELHCFACHWAFASTGVFEIPPMPGSSLHLVDEVIATAISYRVEESVHGLFSRGPPSE